MQKIKNWAIFTKERFEPLSHFCMIAVFLWAHILVSGVTFDITEGVILFIATSAFYFKLRLYDEVKDYELDVIINKHRPLPRGLLTHQDLYFGMIVCVVIEMVAFMTMGKFSFLSLLLPLTYSFFMYKEFFIPNILRPRLTLYAVSHTIVTSFLTLAIFSFLTKESLLVIITQKNFIFFAVANWMLFNIFEFGRKTFADSEERENVETYSSLYGRVGAVILVIFQIIIAHYLTISLPGTHKVFLLLGLGLLINLFLIVSLLYIFKNQSKWAKIYRLFSSLYIIIFYLILIGSYLIN